MRSSQPRQRHRGEKKDCRSKTLRSPSEYVTAAATVRLVTGGDLLWRLPPGRLEWGHSQRKYTADVAGQCDDTAGTPGVCSLVAKKPVIVTAPDGSQINLKDPFVAGFLAWLIPGAGHLYQGRTAKGVLFLACILGTFAYGVFIGGSQVVYASLRAEDYYRLPYIPQVAVGLPALPALVQRYRVEHRQVPLWGGWMAPPDVIQRNNRPSELDRLHGDPGRDFDLGTTFTMIAGLLNVLAIYDAAKGPMFMPPEARKDKPKEPAGSGATDQKNRS